ncbi:MAG TPA: DUF3078 domain-containing protein [Bacteroidetes bacterium]|nr:DUF3078 domain-containing protein [Bacteroidota bacterium]
MKGQKGLFILIVVLFLGIIWSGNVPAQAPEYRTTNQDSLVTDTITQEDSLKAAIEVLKRYYNNQQFWRYDQKNLRKAIGNLINYLEAPPIDSTITYLKNYPFPSLLDTSIYKLTNDTLTSRKVFPIKDTIVSPQDSLVQNIIFGVDTSGVFLSDSLLRILPDNISPWLSAQQKVMIIRGRGDTLIVMSKGKRKTNILQESPWLVIIYRGDTARIPVTDMDYLIANDSLRQTVKTLLQKAENDSTQICFTNLSNKKTCIWLKNNPGDFYRFWLINEYHDSLGLWLQNLSKKNVQLTVDNNVFFHRIDKYKKKSTFRIPLDDKTNTNLHTVKPIVIKISPWKIGGTGSINLSEGVLFNWAKGGESSITTLWLLNSYANYKKGNNQWNNLFRVKYGLLQSGKKRIRKNEDSWELDSKYGLKASKQWYYSAAINIKSQFFKGYHYPNDSVVVSKIMAPGYTHLSLGMDYKPNKKISVLMSPLTLKSTMVLDTFLIDPARYGLEKGKKFRNNMGAYIKSYLRYDFTKDMYLSSRLNIFFQYTHTAANFDWELNYVLKLGPFFNINIYTHLLYDNTQFPVYDESGNKISTTRKMQFKQLLNIGFIYRF